MEEQEQFMPVSPERQVELEDLVQQYADNLDSALGYLEGRQIKKTTAIGARLGCVIDPPAEHERYEGWLCIPYLDQDDRPLTVRFRCLAGHDCRERGHGKYASLSGDRPRIYGVREIEEAEDEIYLTEGEMDSLVLRQLGYRAVAAPGATSWKSHWSSCFARFSRVKVVADGDPAGVEMLTKVRKHLSSAVSVPMPPGYDVNSLYQAKGEDAIHKLMRGEK